MSLTTNELQNVKGGISKWAVVGIVAGVLFTIGFCDGFTRTLKCNK